MQKRTVSRLIGASIRDGSQVTALAGLDVFTMPPKVAQQYRQKPAAAVCSRLEDDPDIPLAAGVKTADFNASTLWDVPDAFQRCVDYLLAGSVDRLTPSSLQAYFEEAGFGDFLPRWTEEQIAIASADGKIPVYAKWKNQLASRAIWLDALMNLSALRSFASDQAALDQRIASLK